MAVSPKGELASVLHRNVRVRRPLDPLNVWVRVLVPLSARTVLSRVRYCCPGDWDHQ